MGVKEEEIVDLAEPVRLNYQRGPITSGTAIYRYRSCSVIARECSNSVLSLFPFCTSPRHSLTITSTLSRTHRRSWTRLTSSLFHSPCPILHPTSNRNSDQYTLQTALNDRERASSDSKKVGGDPQFTEAPNR